MQSNHWEINIGELRLSPKNWRQFAKELTAHPTWIQEIFQFLEEWFDNQEAIWVKTSGSTGRPKTIKLAKAAMRVSAQMTLDFFGLKPRSTFLLNLSPKYIAGKMMLVRAIEGNMSIIAVKPSLCPVASINQAIDFAAMVPAQVQECLDLYPEKFKQINTLIIGGGKAENKLIKGIQKTNVKAFSTYGMTETITHIAIKRLGDPSNPFFSVLPKVKIDTDKRGCLVINADHFALSPIITNDLVSIYAPDQFEWLGRFDNVINTGGVKVSPEEIEQKLSNLMDRRFFVFGMPNEQWGEQVTLMLEGNKFPKEEVNSLLEKMKNVFPSPKRPKEILFCSKFVETPTGKIQRKETIRLAQE